MPGLVDADGIRRMAAAVAPAPLNVMVSTGRPMPSLEELRRAGLRRLTLGGSLMLATYGYTRRLLQDLAKPDAGFGFAAEGITHVDMTKLTQKYA